MTKEEIIQIVEDEDVEFIRLQFTDMFGCLKTLPLRAINWRLHWITA